MSNSKVIHISRKQKISRTSYEWYRMKNKIKAKFHKVGSLLTVFTLALLLLPISPVLSLLSLVFGVLAIYGKILLPFGILALNTFNCNYGLGNTGTDCTPLLGAPKMIIYTPYYNAAGGQNRFSLTQPGTIATTATSKTLTGTNTTFLTTFTVGDIIVITGNTQVYQIAAISSNTAITATVASIATTATTTYNQLQNQAFFVAMTQHPDPTRRWYPTPFLKNADNTRADSLMQTWEDNTEEEVMQGVRKFMGIVPKANASPQLKGKLDNMKLTDVGMYVLDYANNFHIVDILDGFAYPIRIDQNSIRNIYNPGKVKEGAKIDIMFNIHSNEIDANINAISASTFGPTVNIGALKGLKDVAVVVSNITAAGNNLTLALTTLYGDAITPTQVHGLTTNSCFSTSTGALANFYNVTDAADEPITSVTEGVDANGKPNGIYTIVFTSAVTAGDVINLSLVAPGYDFSAVNVVTVTTT